MSIEIHNLSKKYNGNKTKSLNSINMSISEGIFGLLGENGAGKTTLLKTLSTIMPIQEGEILIESFNLKDFIKEFRKELGYLPQKFDFFENLSVYEMLDYIAMLKEVKDELRSAEIIELLKEFNLYDKVQNKIKTLSGGMKQRLAIVQSLIGNPKYIILDEPTVGLDPSERLRFGNIISKRSEGKIIIISTHIISEIAMLCDNVGIMKNGKMIYCGKIDYLLESIEGKIYIEQISTDSLIDKNKYGKIISILRKKNNLEIRFISETYISDNYAMATPTLEDAYFYCVYIN